MENNVSIELILDIGDLITACSAMPSMHVYYANYPVWEMIYDLYKTPAIPGALEPFYEKLNERTPCIVTINEPFIEAFIQYVDGGISSILERSTGKSNLDYTYSMKRWLDSKTIVLEVYGYENKPSLQTKDTDHST